MKEALPYSKVFSTKMFLFYKWHAVHAPRDLRSGSLEVCVSKPAVIPCIDSEVTTITRKCRGTLRDTRARLLNTESAQTPG